MCKGICVDRSVVRYTVRRGISWFSIKIFLNTNARTGESTGYIYWLPVGSNHNGINRCVLNRLSSSSDFIIIRECRKDPTDSAGVAASGKCPKLVLTESEVVALRVRPIISRNPMGWMESPPSWIARESGFPARRDAAVRETRSKMSL